MDKFYDFIRRSSSLVVALADNAAFATLILSYPNLKPQHLVMLHLIAMVAKSIYYKGNKVVKEQEVPVDIIGLPRKNPNDRKAILDLGVGRNFIHNGDLYIKTNQQKNGFVYVVELGTGTMSMLPSTTLVDPKIVTLKVEGSEYLGFPPQR